MTPGRAFVGVSGWRYKSWRGDFYPRGLPQRGELGYIGERMNSAELNGSFYSLQRQSSYERWRDETPADFVFAVKGSRYITHMLALKNTERALANFLASGILALGAKLGPILWQLPERAQFDEAALDDFLGSLPRSTVEASALALHHDARLDGRALVKTEVDRALRHALEVRHPSFASPEAYRIAAAHDVAIVTADSAGKWPVIRGATARLRYVRLHGSRELYTSGYTDAELDLWAADIRGWWGAGQDVYAYFDNDAHGRAPHDAIQLAQLLRDPESSPGT
ncbi:DUF72 domain-containing protein [soil metagenome]